MPRLSVRAALIALSAALLAACGASEAPGSAATAPSAETPAAESDHSGHGEHAADDHHGAESEETAGGSAHVHGAAELAITREGDKLMGELIAPLANFGLAESEEAYTDDVKAKLSGLVTVDGGNCKAGVPHPMTDKSGDHTDAIVHFVWACAQPDDVRAVRFTGFADFPGFETVSTIFITASEQKADDLTPAAPELSLR